ncbi:MAG: hypothetical protein GY923_15245 [Aestuariibacter sp.]|nr:hypothetical protein [Aestuariibacter sp.]
MPLQWEDTDNPGQAYADYTDAWPDNFRSSSTSDVGSAFDPKLWLPIESPWIDDTPNTTAMEAQSARIDTEKQDELRQRQLFLADALRDQMAGEGPSVAQMQMQKGLDRSIAGARSVAMSDPRINPAMANRMAMAAQENLALQGNQQAAMLRAQEQMAAQQQMGALLAGARGQDIGLAGQQAGFEQQTALANQEAANRAAMLDSELYMQGMLGNQETSMGMMGLQNERDIARWQKKEANKQSRRQLVGGVVKAGGEFLGGLL